MGSFLNLKGMTFFPTLPFARGKIESPIYLRFSTGYSTGYSTSIQLVFNWQGSIQLGKMQARRARGDSGVDRRAGQARRHGGGGAAAGRGEAEQASSSRSASGPSGGARPFPSPPTGGAWAVPGHGWTAPRQRQRQRPRSGQAALGSVRACRAACLFRAARDRLRAPWARRGRGSACPRQANPNVFLRLRSGKAAQFSQAQSS